MRIAYLIAWRGGLRTGPFKKMAAQSAAWIDAGHDVRLFVTTSPEAYPDWVSLGEHVTVEVAGGSTLAGGSARRRSYRALRDWTPDLIYLRHGIFAPGLGKLARRFPTVIEVNGDELTLARRGSLPKGLWTACSRGLLLRHVVGGVFMTDELAQSRRFKRYGFRSLVLGNGVSLPSLPELPPNDLPTAGLAMIGHPDSPWHGADKLVHLASRHPNWRIDIIGIGRGEVGQSLPPNLTVHPEMATDAYLRILEDADVGIGSLAFHRLGLEEATPLKVREYLALGLAVITGYIDPDIPPEATYQLRLPNVESNIDEGDERIEKFVESWHRRRLGRDAIAHLDTTVKEATRLYFLTDCLEARPRGSSR